MKKIRSSFVILLAITLPVAITAQEIQPKDTIIVTATRTEIPVSDAIVPITVITRQQIEQSLATDLAELVRFEAGIDIGRSGGPGQTTSIFLRGTESNHTLVLIDGVRMNPGTLGGPAIQNISPEIIDRIEIVKGARSALFGTDAIGGVINIITKRPTRTYAEGSIGGGSFNTQSGFAEGGSISNNGEFGVSFNWQNTDGFPTRIGSDLNRGYDNLSSNIYLRKYLKKNDVSLRHWRSTGIVEYLDFFLSPLNQEFKNTSTSVKIITSLAGSANSELLLSHIIDDVTQNQSDDFVESRRTSLDWQYSVITGTHTLMGGIYIADEIARTTSFGTSFNKNTSMKAVFIGDQWLNERHQTFLAFRLTSHEAIGNKTAWNAEYAYNLSNRWKINVGIAHAFRTPDATDRYGFGGNPNLAPEVANETQFGFRFRPNVRQFVSFEFYQNDIEDLIEFDFSTFQLRNIHQTEIRGTQIAYAYHGENFNLRANLMHQKAYNATNRVRLLRRAEESLTVTLTKNIGIHRIGLSLLASGDRKDFGEQKLDSYILVNLTGQITLSDKWQLNARIENLLDKVYETVAGYRMQELSGFLELKYIWK